MRSLRGTDEPVDRAYDREQELSARTIDRDVKSPKRTSGVGGLRRARTYGYKQGYTGRRKLGYKFIRDAKAGAALGFWKKNEEVLPTDEVLDEGAEAPQYYDHRRVADHENSMELLHSLAHKALKAGDLDTYHRHMDAKAVHAQMRDEINARKPVSTIEGKVDTADGLSKVDRQPGVGTTAAEVLPSTPGANKTVQAADNEVRSAGEKRFVELHTGNTTVVDGPANQGMEGGVSTTHATLNQPEGSTPKSWVQEMADRIGRCEPTADVLGEDVELEEGKIRLHVEPKLSGENRKQLSSFFQTMKRERPSYVTPGHPLQQHGFDYRGSRVTIHYN